MFQGYPLNMARKKVDLAEIGRLAKRCSDAKRRRDEIIADFEQFAQAMAVTSRMLSNSRYCVEHEHIVVPAIYPARETIQGLALELSRANRTIAESRRMLDEAGIGIE